MNTIILPAVKGVTDHSNAIPVQIKTLLPGSSALPQIDLAADTLVIPDLLLPVPTKRLIVLVPFGDIDELRLVHRVWQLATCSNLVVLYLALSPDEDQVSFQRRRLAGMAALTTYPHIRADIGVYARKKWSPVLRQIMEPGDLLVCLAEDYIPGIFRNQRLGEWLAAHLGVPVYELGTLKVNSISPSMRGIKDLLVWITSLGLIVAFFWLQVSIDQALAEPLSTILLCLSVAAELFSIMKINEWIG